MTKVYLVMQQPEGSDRESEFSEISGIFSSSNKAIKACRNQRYCYAEVILDHQFPDETINGLNWIVDPQQVTEND